MNIKNENLIKVGSLQVLLWRKEVKNFHLNVLPPDGKVRVTIPVDVSDEVVRAFIASKISWIKKHQNNFQNQLRQSPREYVSGESHYFFGHRYLLEVQEMHSYPSVSIKNKKKIVLICRDKKNTHHKKKIIDKWNREKLREFLKKKVPIWEKKIGVKVYDWKIRKMKTKWGSCNPVKSTVNFNLELAKYPEACIEYIIVHELLHLIERKHNDRFKKLLDQYYPKWRQYKDALNKVILADFNDYK
ncbi:MAG: SprT family zinc-dependent metalloprotease [Candidatus Dojkabacteria bacterium]